MSFASVLAALSRRPEAVAKGDGSHRERREPVGCRPEIVRLVAGRDVRAEQHAHHHERDRRRFRESQHHCMLEPTRDREPLRRKRDRCLPPAAIAPLGGL